MFPRRRAMAAWGSTTGDSASPPCSWAGEFVSRPTAAPSAGHKALSPFRPWLSGHANVGICVTGWSRGAPSGPPASCLGVKVWSHQLVRAIGPGNTSILPFSSSPFLYFNPVERVATRFVLEACYFLVLGADNPSLVGRFTPSDITPEGDVRAPSQFMPARSTIITTWYVWVLVPACMCAASPAYDSSFPSPLLYRSRNTCPWRGIPRWHRQRVAACGLWPRPTVPSLAAGVDRGDALAIILLGSSYSPYIRR